MLQRLNEKTNITESSRKTYMSYLRTLKKINGRTKLTEKFVSDIKKIRKSLESRSNTYKATMYSAIIATLDNGNTKKLYQDEISILKLLIEGENKSRKTKIDSSFKDIEKVVDIIKKTLDKNPVNFFKVYQHYIISLLYLKTSFTCRLDFCNMELIFSLKDLDDTKNQMFVPDTILDLSKPNLQTNRITIYFNQFKNKKHIGCKTFEINEKITKEIRKFIKYKEDNSITNDFLFVNNKGGCFNNKRFSELVKSIFKIYLNLDKITLNTIRKLKETKLMQSEEYKQMSFAQKEEAHLNNFHNKRTAEIFYNLF